MSKVKGYSSGRSTLPHSPTLNVLKYFGRPRSPSHPSAFRRENMLDDDLTKEWNNSRRHGPGYYNSGYSTLKEIKWDDHSTPITPITELAKFMPDIRIDGIQSTPVSMMSVRNGHRVTHDLLHSYDPAISRQVLYKSKEDGMTSPMIDHGNISPHDPNFFGLHPQTIGSRARIYRYLRRAPFSDETFYYRRYVKPFQRTDSQKALLEEIISLCRCENDIEKASSVYRLLTHPPTAAVVTAMLDCCSRLRLMGDAAALFEDFRRANRNECRSKEVLQAYMNVAIACDHPQHAISILGFVHGTTVDNFRYNGLTKVEKFMIGQNLLIWLIAKGYHEAKSVYWWMKERDFLEYDSYFRDAKAIAHSLRHFLSSDEDKEKIADELREQIEESVSSDGKDLLDPKTRKNLLRVTELHMECRMLSNGAFTRDWLQEEFKSLHLPYISHLTDYILQRNADPSTSDDALANLHSKMTYDAMLLLQPDMHRSAQHVVLPYLRKSSASRYNPCVRVINGDREVNDRDTSSRPEFYFSKDGSTKFVRETFEVLDNLNVRQIYYGRNPIHTVESAERWN